MGRSGKRLRRVMVHKCDIYKPIAIAPLEVSDLEAMDERIEAADLAFDPTPAYTNVTCSYQGTPEFDGKTLAGITLDVNILTSDRWWFLQDQVMKDAWMIVMRSPDHPFYNKAWITQGNPYMIASVPGRPTDSLMIYSRQAHDMVVPGRA